MGPSLLGCYTHPNTRAPLGQDTTTNAWKLVWESKELDAGCECALGSVQCALGSVQCAAHSRQGQQVAGGGGPGFLALERGLGPGVEVPQAVGAACPSYRSMELRQTYTALLLINKMCPPSSGKVRL